MLKRAKIVISILLIMFLCGCGVDSVKVNNPLTKKEIIDYIKKEIYNETGDETIVNIVKKKELSVCTESFDDCQKYQNVENGYSYEVEIINKENDKIVGTGTYNDGYILYDDKKYVDGQEKVDSSFTSNYKKQKGLFFIKNEFINALNESSSKYYIFENNNEFPEGYAIFINSSNYDDINNLLLKLRNTVLEYRNLAYFSYNIFIYKDQTAFNNINFELYKEWKDNYDKWARYGEYIVKKYTEKDTTVISYAYDLNKELFTSNGTSAARPNNNIDYKSFDYFIFWYDAETNSFVGYNTPLIEVIGIK